MELRVVQIVGIVGQVGIVALEILVSLVEIPGVVGLVASEGLLGVSYPFYPFYPYNQQYHNGAPPPHPGSAVALGVHLSVHCISFEQTFLILLPLLLLLESPTGM